ncbi:relaxase/mobilization nuclease domain-containing protein [Pedobacter miscanthi]|uniref:MobA/VirD2-like nuclease domain-containing protein n=1 Tax=Pedobacter miscanthi TaxID=2259170 RepID=A0A366L6N6_9SPHI|nr:relaxase/mobilization nuclease domain-containing protein [Pedobacter miscanthi]RBQ08954.1 hypothetical protein DRW42_07030 [Pedobacter miscanthi]
MIVKILSSSASFSGVNYNTDKIEQGKGELVNVSNFGVLQFLSELRPSDYINYFKAVSAMNKRVAKPQFHAVISAKGKSTFKEDLTRIAQLWLTKMGYGKNPYLLVFHNDTKNNHVHAVSTRIDKAGKKISSAFEKLRSIRMLSQVLDQENKTDINLERNRILKYHFSTLAQLKLLFELRGLKVSLGDGDLKIDGFNGQQSRFRVSEIENWISINKNDLRRAAQISKIIEKYKNRYSPVLIDYGRLHEMERADVLRYRSELGDFLHSKFGIQLIFHYSGDRIPYGYTIIDHAEQNVFKGSNVMKMAILVGGTADSQVINDMRPLSEHKNQNFQDTSLECWTGASDLDIPAPSLPNLAEDIDDEAILGRNRQRKGKARTNTR